MCLRAGEPDSAGSQFFIMQGSFPTDYDGKYAAFGKLMDDESLSVLNALGSVAVDASYRPLVLTTIDTIRVDTHGYTFPFVKVGEEGEAAASGRLETHRGGCTMKNPIVTITMENGRAIKAELYPDVAPNTVANFVSLVEKGFYDGLIFHRVIPGFISRAATPPAPAWVAPGYRIQGEFRLNGVKNDLKHTRGVLSMARSMHPDSAGSQFFIMHADAPHLDGQYAAFGKVIEGNGRGGRDRQLRDQRPGSPPQGAEDQERYRGGLWRGLCRKEGLTGGPFV